MALYQDGILISGANTLPKMTLADYKAMPDDKRPTYWERLDADYDDILAEKTDIATVESGTTASRAYSVGELVYVNSTLYRVKTAIASGATFTVGTNVEVTNVSQNIFKHFNRALGTNSCPAGISQIETDIPLNAFNVCPYISAYTAGGVRQVILTMLKSSSAWIVCVNNVSTTTQNVAISVDYLI